MLSILEDCDHPRLNDGEVPESIYDTWGGRFWKLYEHRWDASV